MALSPKELEGNRRRNRRYLERHREELRQRAREKYHADLEHSRERCRERHNKPEVKAKRAASVKAWHAKNKSRVLERQRIRRARNLEQTRQQTRDWHAANRETSRALSKAWREAHPETDRVRSARRRSRKRGALCDCPLIDKFLLFVGSDIPPCYWCGRLANSHDHLQPISRGGLHSYANVQPCCRRCNSQKKDRTHDEYVTYLLKLGKAPAFNELGKQQFERRVVTMAAALIPALPPETSGPATSQSGA